MKFFRKIHYVVVLPDKFIANLCSLFYVLLSISCNDKNDEASEIAIKSSKHTSPVLSFSEERVVHKESETNKIFTYQVLFNEDPGVLLSNGKFKYLYFSSESSLDAVGSLYCLHHGVFQYNLNKKNIFLVGYFKKNGKKIIVEARNEPDELRVDAKELNEFVLKNWFIKSPFEIWSPKLGEDDLIITLNKLTRHNFDPNEQLIPIGRGLKKYTLPKLYDFNKHVK